MQEYDEHQNMITTKQYSSLKTQNALYLFFVINVSWAPPTTALISTDEEVKM